MLVVSELLAGKVTITGSVDARSYGTTNLEVYNSRICGCSQLANYQLWRLQQQDLQMLVVNELLAGKVTIAGSVDACSQRITSWEGYNSRICGCSQLANYQLGRLQQQNLWMLVVNELLAVEVTIAGSVDARSQRITSWEGYNSRFCGCSQLTNYQLGRTVQ